MGLFGGRSREQRRLAETGTRVPAELVGVERTSFLFKGTNNSQRNATRSSKQRWVAQLPEGGSLEFEVRSRWSPPVGTCVEAAVSGDRTEAVLVLDQDDYSIWDDQDRIQRDFGASKLAAHQLRNAARAPGEPPLPPPPPPPPPPPSLRDLKGR
jgi:hypothetical protein